jgi:hypothetical protein
MRRNGVDMASDQRDLAMLAAVVRQAGGEIAQVTYALAKFHQRLIADGQQPARILYVYRTNRPVDATMAASGDTPRPGLHPRLLLAFLSADAAVSFAQRTGLARSPRLLTLSPARALAIFLQQPGLSALHIAYDDLAAPDGLPVGWRLSRAEVLAMFAIDSRVV